MNLDPKFAGTKIKPFAYTVDARRTMNYAAAICDANPHYLDDTRPDGIVAPPLFAVAITWQISKRLWEFIDAPDFPMQAFLTQVHYSEDLLFHRLMRPGDKLTLTGEIAAIMPHRAGTHVVVRYEAVDAKGEQVFTNQTGAMLREVTCGEGGGAENVPEVPKQDADNQPLWSEIISIDPLAAHVYDGCADIYFPIHTSPKFARGVGLPGIILQGTATLAHAARHIIDHEAAGNPAALKRIATRFSGMVLPGTEIDLLLNGKTESGGGCNLFFTVKNAEGKNALNHGYARVENV